MCRVAAIAFLAACASAQPAGSEACRRCHPAQFDTHVKTLMARSLFTGADSAVLRDNPRLEFQDGPYRYLITRQGGTSLYSVTDGKETLTVPIPWGLGNGAVAQTFVYERAGRLYESRVSFYRKINALDVTVGFPPGTPPDVVSAAGRLKNNAEIIACFECHSAPNPSPELNRTARASLAWTQARIPGVQCENCHTGAPAHAAELLRGAPKPSPVASFKDFVAQETSELCGRCHRTYSDIKAVGPRGVANVRFQPYRIEFSKCWDANDTRIACTACHDPHRTSQSVPPRAYDKACQACHNANPKTPPHFPPLQSGQGRLRYVPHAQVRNSPLVSRVRRPLHSRRPRR
jgi:hypothetical protein